MFMSFNPEDGSMAPPNAEQAGLGEQFIIYF